MKHISQQFCRVELALRRSCAPVSEAWATFLQFATEHNHVEEVRRRRVRQPSASVQTTHQLMTSEPAGQMAGETLMGT